ncbi:PREDICTED: uncharacterized protein LOC105459818 [Wasmannia auropunctata]|uniref:uncharacterized protein LOC105459818 n=1 Tax=Wasmannia auropunctata TaxID=64793 RepID=UPI0005EF242E|nr:PREDICTED: uncharacterized protein LOC105459818 [Wasmannia auropunctata]
MLQSHNDKWLENQKDLFNSIANKQMEFQKEMFHNEMMEQRKWEQEELTKEREFQREQTSMILDAFTKSLQSTVRPQISARSTQSTLKPLTLIPFNLAGHSSTFATIQSPLTESKEPNTKVHKFNYETQ